MADSLVETVASSSHIVNLNSMNQITAEIHVESHLQSSPPPVPSSTTASPPSLLSVASTSASSSSSSAPSSEGKKTKNQNIDDDEPDIKRKKPNQRSLQKVEKLELRLGGILCCAVCLDLPRTAMYQVIFCSTIHFFCLFFLLWFINESEKLHFSPWTCTWWIKQVIFRLAMR